VDLPVGWRHLLIVESAPRSHFDILVELSREGKIPTRPLLCLAGEGRGFHGMRGRPWAALAGNLHLVAGITANRALEAGGLGISAIAASAVVEAIDTLPGLAGRAGIKWVNDVVIDGAKVGGVLAHTHQSEGVILSAVIGIGVNVETRPEVEPTPYVPKVARLADFSPCSAGELLIPLVAALDRSCRLLLGGGQSELLEAYRRRSMVLGRVVRIDEESGETIARGRVQAIGSRLELILEGREKPVARGRLVLDDDRGDFVA
jgi:BirA family biotin operon repressor/biotin-[acetyl-CoA-carboxylase] ligase